MNIAQLRYAVEVAKSGSVNRASETLLMGQPNLSRAIRELERTLGIIIFKRSPKGMSVTPVGEKFLKYAQRIISEIDEMKSICSTGITANRRFAVSAPSTGYISEAFSAFSRNISENDRADLFFKETDSEQTLVGVLESDYDLGIIRYAKKHENYFKDMLENGHLKYKSVTEFNYLLLISCKHVLASKENTAYSDLNSFTEIAYTDNMIPSYPIASASKDIRAETQRRIFVSDRASQFDMLSENTATYMWSPPLSGKLLKRYNLIQKMCSDNKEIYKDALIYRDGYQLSELDKLFVAELKNAVSLHGSIL